MIAISDGPEWRAALPAPCAIRREKMVMAIRLKKRGTCCVLTYWICNWIECRHWRSMWSLLIAVGVAVAVWYDTMHCGISRLYAHWMSEKMERNTEHQIEWSTHFILSATGRNRRSIQCFRFSFIQTTRNIRQIVLFESRSSFCGMQVNKISFYEFLEGWPEMRSLCSFEWRLDVSLSCVFHAAVAQLRVGGEHNGVLWALFRMNQSRDNHRQRLYNWFYIYKVTFSILTKPGTQKVISFRI